MIREKLYNHYTKTEQREPQEEVTFAPSYLCDCARKIYYNKTGEEITNPIQEHSYLKMGIGSAVHEYLQNKLKEIDVLVECEDRKQHEIDGLLFNYHLDGIVKAAGEPWILEIKTTFGFGWKSVEKEPKPEHCVQLCFYMLAEEIDFGLIWYVDRGNAHNIEYHMKKDSKLWETSLHLLRKRLLVMKQVKKCIEDKTPPAGEYDIVLKRSGGDLSEKFQKDGINHKSAWQCTYCKWKDLCHGAKYEEIKKHQFYIGGQFI